MMTLVRMVICGVLAANLAAAHDYGGLDDPANTNTTVAADPDPPRQDEPQVATCPPSIADDLSGFWRRQDKNDRGPDPLFTKIKVMSFVVGHVFFDEASFRGVGRLVPCTRKVIADATHKELNVQVFSGAQGTLSDDGDAIHWHLADGKPLRTWRRVGSRAQRRKAQRAQEEDQAVPAPEPVTEPSAQPIVSIDPETQQIKVTWTDACPEEGVSTDEGCERFRVGVQNMYDQQRKLDEQRRREREEEKRLAEEERHLAERAAETSGDLDAELSGDPTEVTPKDVAREEDPEPEPESESPAVDGGEVEVGTCVRILRGSGKGVCGHVLRLDEDGDPIVDLGNGKEQAKNRASVEAVEGSGPPELCREAC